MPWLALLLTLERTGAFMPSRTLTSRGTALSSLYGEDSFYLREFQPSDLTLAGFVGSVGVMEVSDFGGGIVDPSAPRRSKTATSTRVRIFLARLNDAAAAARGEDLRVSLREYSSNELTEREIEAHSKLPRNAPVVTLLGTLDGRALEGDDSFIEAWVSNLRVEPPAPNAYWLVYKWAGSRSAAELPADPEPRFALFPSKVPRWHARMRETVRQALEAVAAIHDAGIAHGSLGLSSIILDSKQQDKTVGDLALLVVRLDFFGFSTPAALEPIAEDLRALGYAFFELVFSKANANQPDQDTLKRLYVDIFDSDMDRFREYAEDEPDWQPVVEFLNTNDRSGWFLLDKMLTAANSAAKSPTLSTLTLLTARGLLSSPFFSAKPRA